MADVILADVFSSNSNVTAAATDVDELFHQLRHMERTLHAVQRNMDDFFFVTLTAITFAMQCGFAFMEVGLVRTKNTTNILLKSTVDAFVGCLSYWLFGYAIAWSEGNSFVGWNNWAFSYLPPEKFSVAFYQLIFANTASTIVSGAVAERLNLPCYFIYGFLLTGFSYPFVSRWGWYDGGFLKEMGYRDFGGSGLVHMFSGACAFVAANIIGARTGRFAASRGDSSQEHHGQHIPGHSLPFVGLGALLLIFGFLAFNAASQLSISKAGDGPIITYSALNTLLGCSGGALSALLINRFLPFWGNYWSYITMVNGAVAGMAAICAGCDSMAPWAAVLTGVLAGLSFIAGRALLEKIQVDDPIDAFPIHFCGGIVGLLSAPFLVADGILFKRDLASAVVLGCNMLGTLVIIGWAVLWCVPIFGLLKWLGVLRIPADMERTGVDVAKHNEPAYPSSAWQQQKQQDHINNKEWMVQQQSYLHFGQVKSVEIRHRGSGSHCTEPASTPVSLPDNNLELPLSPLSVSTTLQSFVDGELTYLDASSHKPSTPL